MKFPLKAPIAVANIFSNGYTSPYQKKKSGEEKVSNSGTSEGVKKEWETRKIGGDPVAESLWHGTEHKHSNGAYYRTVNIPGDARREVHVFDKHGLSHWRVSLPDSVPPSVHDAAVEAAKKYVSNLKHGV